MEAAEGVRDPAKDKEQAGDCSDAGEDAGLDEAGWSRRFNRQFFKTRICKFWKKGRCASGTACEFAHGQHELEIMPNLSGTTVCPHVRASTTCKDPKCLFAHSFEQLRATNTFYKTKLCAFQVRGHCFLGLRCRYAHTDDELRRAIQSRECQTSAMQGNSEDEAFVGKHSEDEAFVAEPGTATKDTDNRAGEAAHRVGDDRANDPYADNEDVYDWAKYTDDGYSTPPHHRPTGGLLLMDIPEGKPEASEEDAGIDEPLAWSGRTVTGESRPIPPGMPMAPLGFGMNASTEPDRHMKMRFQTMAASSSSSMPWQHKAGVPALPQQEWMTSCRAVAGASSLLWDRAMSAPMPPPPLQHCEAGAPLPPRSQQQDEAWCRSMSGSSSSTMLWDRARTMPVPMPMLQRPPQQDEMWAESSASSSSLTWDCSASAPVPTLPWNCEVSLLRSRQQDEGWGRGMSASSSSTPPWDRSSSACGPMPALQWPREKGTLPPPQPWQQNEDWRRATSCQSGSTRPSSLQDEMWSRAISAPSIAPPWDGGATRPMLMPVLQHCEAGAPPLPCSQQQDEAWCRAMSTSSSSTAPWQRSTTAPVLSLWPCETGAPPPPWPQQPDAMRSCATAAGSFSMCPWGRAISAPMPKEAGSEQQGAPWAFGKPRAFAGQAMQMMPGLPAAKKPQLAWVVQSTIPEA